MRLQPILDQIAEAMTSLLRSEYSLIRLTEEGLFQLRAKSIEADTASPPHREDRRAKLSA